jgi:hypothetical protein
LGGKQYCITQPGLVMRVSAMVVVSRSSQPGMEQRGIARSGWDVRQRLAAIRRRSLNSATASLRRLIWLEAGMGGVVVSASHRSREGLHG